MVCVLVSWQRSTEVALIWVLGSEEAEDFHSSKRPLWGLLEGLLTPTQTHVESLTCGASFLSEAAKAEAMPTSQVVHLCREYQDFPSNPSCTWHWNVHHLQDINGIYGFQKGLTKKDYFFDVIILSGQNQVLAAPRNKIFPSHILEEAGAISGPLKPLLDFQGFTTRS